MGKGKNALIQGLIYGFVFGLPTIVVQCAKQADQVTALTRVTRDLGGATSAKALRDVPRAELSRHFKAQVKQIPEFVSQQQFLAEEFIAQPVIGFSAPKNANEFHNIFDRDGSADQVNKTARLIGRFLENTTVPTESLARSSDLNKLIASEENSVVFIIGHNDNGNFKTTSGEGIRIESISKSCQEFQKRCIILSCNSAQYLDVETQKILGIEDEITYGEAMLMSVIITENLDRRLRSALRRINSDNPFDLVPDNTTGTSFQELDLEIKVSLSKAKNTTRTLRQIELVGKIAGISAASGTIVYSIGSIDRRSE